MEGTITLRVAVDAMGGDNAPGEIVKGAVDALSRCRELNIYLVGQEDLIYKCLSGLDYPEERLEVKHAPEVISGNDDPGLSIRSKKKSSLVMAQKMVSNGDADAVVSAGNTGAVMAGGVLFLGRVPGVSRPALLTTFPVFQGKGVVILDVGANMDARPEQLVQYALMGKIYAREVLKRSEPSIALLNVGTENNKGNEKVKKAYELLSKNITGFYGNVEANQVLSGVADVIVCDGFAGNVFLKTAEGVAMGVFNALKREFCRSLRSKIGAGLLYKSLRNLYIKMDASEYGGAPLIGVTGICIKCHGSSEAKAIENAIVKQVHPLVKNRVTEVIEDVIKDFS